MDVADLFESIEPSVVRLNVTTQRGGTIGSGFLVGPGLLATNYHVVEDALDVVAEYPDGTRAEVTGYRTVNPLKDIAILKIAPDDARRPLALATRGPRRGDDAYAFGAPKGLSFSASEGIVSAIREEGEMRRCSPRPLPEVGCRRPHRFPPATVAGR